MIDFACKQFKFMDVVKCALGLSKADFNTLQYLLTHEEDWQTTEKLASTLGFNLSTVQRTVKKLYEKSLVKRMQSNFDGGGYAYTYQIAEKEEIRKVILEIINQWVEKVSEELKEW